MTVKIRLKHAPQWGLNLFLFGIAVVLFGVLFFQWGRFFTNPQSSLVPRYQASLFELPEQSKVEPTAVVLPQDSETLLNTKVDQNEPVELVFEDTGIRPYLKDLSIKGLASEKLEGGEFEVIRVLAENEWYTRYQVQYQSNGTEISGVFIIPKTGGPFPLLMLNHGYFPEDEYTLGRGLKREQDFFGLSNYAVLHSDYRGHAFSDANPDDRLLYDSSFGYAMDVINGITALQKSNFKKQIDFEKIGMLGHSMGGDIALDIAVTYPELVDAFVLYAPASGDAWKNFDRWKREEPYAEKTLNTFGSYADDPDTWDELSASGYLENLSAPMLVFHGEKDDVVPVEWSDSLVRNLEEKEKEIRYVIYPEEDHQFEDRYWDFVWEARRFFDSKLR